ncbi:TRAP transporter large permease [Neisseria animalis]|uniref:TRAP transporter large permease protein n=1 Tax=Neisseria animalis TaxID=492 RepID=A0A5P3MQL0_NEIAN|nr:TRAP transporter large permease [Neisseria animalis]QEY23864.1 TRAP transporter large permease [Neisseria animalis]ROW32070.1 TRAP transporter large permease [Neisseria animalis]VEE05738.1 Neu5Ac permease [Neisseria animalis]
MWTLTVFLILLLIGFPIYAAILCAALLFMFTDGQEILMGSVPLRFFNSLETGSLLAVPLFVLVGEIMNKGGLTRRLIAVTELFVGRLKGGLAYTNLATNALAASILGSAVAQIGVMSRVMIPPMEKQGYDKAFASAVTVSGGLLGPIFPPSMLMIIYSVVAVQPIIPLFIAGIIPATLIFFGLCAVVFATGILTKQIPETSTHISPKLPLRKILFDGLLPGMIPGVIVAGIAAGIMTPTEAGAVASLIAFILCFAYGEIKIRDLSGIFLSVCLLTATICGLIAAASLLSWVLTFQGIPDQLVAFVGSLTTSPFGFMLLVAAVLILLGMFLESISALIVLVPILMPVVKQLGIDPVQFGVICTIATAIGVLTPPVGPGLFVVMAQTQVRMSALVRQLVPFLLAVTAMLVLLAAIPELSTWLPKLVLSK